MSAVRNDHRGLFTGRYAFHLHTTLTDGSIGVEEYFAFASAHGVERLIFLEHIRRKPTYDVEAFIDDVQQASLRAGVASTMGFEAKILPGGQLDIDEKHIDVAEVLGIAEHGFPEDVDLLTESLRSAFDRFSLHAGAKNVVWVHPGLALKRWRLLDSMHDEYRELIQYAWDLGIAVERNLRYQLPPDELLSAPDASTLVTGLDAHRHSDLVRAFGERPGVDAGDDEAPG